MGIRESFLFADMQDFTVESESRTPRILVVSLVGAGFGGLETHVLSLGKHLSARGHSPLMLVAVGSQLHDRLAKEKLSYRAARWCQRRGGRHLLPFIFEELCNSHSIRVIHCNNRFEVAGAVRVTKHRSTKVILNYHVPTQFDTNVLDGVDAFISPASEIVEFVRQDSREREVAIRLTQAIPPLFDAETFLDYHSMTEPAEWFLETLGITTKSCPMICMIGNMVPDLEHKNYPLLFQAMALLIHEKKKPVQAVLVGDGPVRPYLEQLAKSYRIDEYVHFVGFVRDNIAGVLHHSDMFVLASSREAFGIVYLEAALSRKPSIGAYNTGAEMIIVPEQTGLLFENGNARSLANAVQRLAEDRAWSRDLGARAYGHVIANFVPSMVIKRYEKLYDDVSKT